MKILLEVLKTFFMLFFLTVAFIAIVGVSAPTPPSSSPIELP